MGGLFTFVVAMMCVIFWLVDAVVNARVVRLGFHSEPSMAWRLYLAGDVSEDGWSSCLVVHQSAASSGGMDRVGECARCVIIAIGAGD